MARSRRGRWLAPAVVSLLALAPRPAFADENLLEFHFTPVAGLQIAIWLERPDGTPIKDVFVTQATGKLGIGNRPGLWNFLSSWHAPYGPRLPVLPIWGHRRDKAYPALVFHDSNPQTQGSLGFHEGTSSFESYFCRPLDPEQNELVIDAMSCPSPQVFQSDKGRFSAQTSVYPPRNDLLASNFEDIDDHPDVLTFADVNDLDAVTGATPSGDAPALRTVKLTREEAADGPVVAWIEVSLEHDENADWDFDRELDHHVDGKLPAYGVEWLGQPSVVYRVEVDPEVEGFFGVDEYFGYGEWDGSSGAINDPDSTISTADGSGADRLRQMDEFGDLFRFGVYSHGYGPGGGDGGSGTDDGDDGGGSCSASDLPALEDLVLSATAFDRVAVEFSLPSALPAEAQLDRVRVFSQQSVAPLEPVDVLRGREQQFTLCAPGEGGCDVEAGPGDTVRVEVDQLFGDFTYQFAVTYEDLCTNASPPQLGSATTPVQSFQQIDAFCVVATAAYGAGWAQEVGALRALRDAVLARHRLGRQAVRTYYAYGPALARVIGYGDWLRAGTRVVLQPIADMSRPLTRWSQ